MYRPRVIPILLLSGPKLIKTYKFKNPSYVGDPINAIKIFNEKEVDELIILDIDASKKNTGPNYKLIEKVASECFMPLCYGGGISNVDQAAYLFKIGIEKISIQSAALQDINLIKKLSDRFGSQSIVISIDVKRNIFGIPCVYSSVKRKKLNINFYDYIKLIDKSGAGEILLSNIDKEGTGRGLDLSLIDFVTKRTSLPVIANSGVGSILHIQEGIFSGANAVAAGSFFIYYGPHKAVLITYPNLDNLKFVKNE
jgi:cyclase